MSRMGEKVLEIQEMLVEHPQMLLEEIAEICNVDVDFVQDVESTMDSYEYDGQPDEAQEW